MCAKISALQRGKTGGDVGGMNAITLTNPTDDELSAAVAEHVAGLTISFGCIASWRQLPNGEPEEVQDGPIPNYSTSADAVLPLLEKWASEAEFNGPSIHMTPDSRWLVSLHNADDIVASATARTLPRAACIALLRANGVEVVT